jgi:hypothetical protein
MELDFEYKSLDYVSVENGSVELDLNRLWSHKGHNLGDGMISPDHQWFYLNIPKNSSSSIKKTLSDVGWTHADRVDFPEAKLIIALRDPIDRWISGMSEYLMMYHQDTIDQLISPMSYDCYPLLGERLGLSLLFDRITFDDHTERQVIFLHDIDTTEAVWFMVDRGFNNKFVSFLSSIGYKDAVAANENSTEDDSYGAVKKRKLQEFLKFVLGRNEFYSYNLKQWFWCDEELIKQVGFYEG